MRPLIKFCDIPPHLWRMASMASAIETTSPAAVKKNGGLF
jgi:hypothetical protein